MIRIMTADEPALTTITVDGQLAGDSVQAVETTCDQTRANGKPIWLHLRDVSVIGEDGQALLRRLASKGVRLKASGLYTSYVVRSIQPDPSSTPVSTLASTTDEIASPRQEIRGSRRAMPVRGGTR